jgi:hypothetical protein
MKRPVTSGGGHAISPREKRRSPMTPQEIAAKVGEHFATSEWVMGWTPPDGIYVP